MAKYRVTTPDGKVFEVTAPDGVDVTEEQIGAELDKLQQQTPTPPPNPYAKLSTAQLKGAYRAAQARGQKDLLPKIADAYVKREYQESSPIGQFGTEVSDVVRTAARGVPVIGGVLDEASAGLDSLMPGGNYEESLDYQRARDRAADQKPGSVGVQLAGGLLGTLAGARLFGAGVGSQRFSPLAKLGIGAGTGAAIGAADFFGRGENGLPARATDAVIGAGVGGILGGISPGIGSAVSAGTRRLMNFLSSDAALQRLGISRPAAEILLRQLSADDTLSSTGARRILASGPDAMMADAGPSASNLLDTAIQRSGPGSTAAREAVEQRATAANRNLTQSLDRTLGQPAGIETQQEAIRRGTAGARSSAYDAAYARPIDYAGQGGQQLETLLGRVPQEAINSANRLMRAEGQQSRQILARMNPDGTVTFERMPDVRQLDYITRGLNEVARGAEGQGVLGGTTAAGRIYGNLSREIRSILRNEVPEYGAALDTAADPIRRVQAIDFGATILNPKVTREQVARELQGMSAAERRAAMSGLRQQVDDLAAKIKQSPSDSNIESRELRETLGALTSRANREKLQFLLGNGAGSRQFFRDVARASRAMELKASVATNSKTYGRASTEAQAKTFTEPGILGTLMQGSPIQAAKKFIQTLTRMTPERRLAAEDRIFGEIARELTQVRGPAAARRLIAFRNALRARVNNTATGVAAGRLGQSAYAGTVSGGVSAAVDRQ